MSSSPEEDRQQPIVPKEEQDVETSPRSQMISSVLVSIRRDNPPLEPPSFDLGVKPPLLTPQTMDVIDEIDDQLQKNPNLLRTPDPLGTSHILADMEKRVAIWGTVPKEDNEWLPVFKLKGDKPLDALRYQFKSMQPLKYVDIQVQRMFEKYEHRWKDPKSRKTHEISTLLNINEYLGYMEKDGLQTHRFLFAPVLCFEHWWMYVLDVEKKHLFVLDSKNVQFPTPERTEMNKFASNILDQLMQWAGREFMFKKGHTCLMPMYINVPQQPNNHDCAIFVMKWMEELDPTTLRDSHAGTKEHNIPLWTSADLDKFREKIVANILLSPENFMRMDVVTEVNEIRLTKPGAALRSPFTQFDSADLKTN
ncbi:hypothetical protein PIB30_063623 [Stylosanthes scabra]|uniref:Ubiquitin-like protease family profile domain-containing protein n=1 Tax=Stylosanthes scabra TaxID=79078 RepID=A0ABU6QMB0_9FABA|nr:hypothetical protein [Stylosanthes scabra]